MNQQSKKILALLFLVAEAVLYYFVLTAGGTTFTITSYGSIILCFLFAMSTGLKTDPLIAAGLACTVGADFCLVVLAPIQQLWGMVFFLGAQTFYAIKLHRDQKSKAILFLRIFLITAIEIITILILKDSVDPLAVISVCYYANLFVNIIAAFAGWRKHKLLPIAFLLFILCDTVIGLQVAAGRYLPIAEGSALYDFLFMPFNLSWFFYLPSQVLIALTALTKGDKK